MGAFYQPKPDSERHGYKPTEYDNLSDEELQKLLNQCKVRVASQVKPQAPKYVDLDRIIDNG